MTGFFSVFDPVVFQGSADVFDLSIIVFEGPSESLFAFDFSV